MTSCWTLIGPFVPRDLNPAFWLVCTVVTPLTTFVQCICKYHLHTVEYTHRPKRGAKGYVQRVSSGKRFLLCGRPAKLTGMPLEGGSGRTERVLILNWGNQTSFADTSLRKQGANEEGYKLRSKHFLILALLFSSFSLFVLQVIARSATCFADSLRWFRMEWC